MTREEKRAYAVQLRAEGHSPPRIARKLGIALSTTYRLLNPTAEQRARECSQAWKDANGQENRARDLRLYHGYRCACGTVTGIVNATGEPQCEVCRHEEAWATSTSVAICSCGSPMLAEAMRCGLCELEMESC